MIRRATLSILILMVACGRSEPKAIRPAAAPAIAAVAPPVTPKPLEGNAPAAPTVEPIARDLPDIVSGKTLRVLFTFSSTGYFIYRGETMGHEYELLNRYAKEMNVRLAPVVVRDSRTLFDRLNAGDGDVVAAQLVVSPNENGIELTNGLYATAPVVVQRNQGASPAAGMPPAVATALAREEHDTGGQQITVRARLISQPAELAGQRVDISKSSPYRRQLLELNNSVGDDIDVVEVDESTDKLIERLSEGQIGFTVAPENLAALKQTEFSNLIIIPALGPAQQIAWAVRRNAPQLLASLNGWIDAQKRKGLIATLNRKYFLDRRAFTTRAKSEYPPAENGRLSPFDDWFREYAKIPGWDWRLVAAQAFQESKFNPNAHSWAGAIGLMQIMPRTAREMRANPRDPRQSIEAACRYLWKLDAQLKEAIPSEDERIKFILGAYNVGLGHVADGQRLAKKYGNDPGSWDDVGYWLIRKSKRSVYNDPVVKYGFARGTEPVAYVELILERFAHYKALVPEAPELQDSSAYAPGK